MGVFVSYPNSLGKPSGWTWVETREKVPIDATFVSLLDINPVKMTKDKYGKSVPSDCSHEYFGPYAIDIDMDNKPGSHVDKPKTREEARDAVINVINLFVDSFEVNPSMLRIYFSGEKGYHIEFPPKLFGVTKFEKLLPLYYKEISFELGFNNLVDHSIYNLKRGRLWRQENKKRVVEPFTHKIPITYEELLEYSSDVHFEWAKKKRELSNSVVAPEPNEKLIKLIDKLRKKPAVKISKGVTKKEIQAVISGNFDGADCVAKIIQNKNIKFRKNFHELCFLFAVYAYNLDWTVEKTLDNFDTWLRKRQSNSYPTIDSRIEHMRVNYEHVKNGEYEFSCDAMRKIVSNPECAICPINLSPQTWFDEMTMGVYESKGSYRTTKFDRKGEARTHLLSYGVVCPVARSYNMDNKVPHAFTARIVFPNAEVNKLLDLDNREMMDASSMEKHVQAQIGYKPGFFLHMPNKREFDGIKQVIIKRLDMVPLYLNAERAQGAHFNKEDNQWYWADSHGTKTSNWTNSFNVRLNTFKEIASMRTIPKQSITKYRPLKSRTKEFVEAQKCLRLMSKVNSEKAMYSIVGWVAASFFKNRFRHLRDTDNQSNIHCFPIFFHLAQSGTGKSTLDKSIIMRLCAYDQKDEAQLPLFTYFTLISTQLTASNSCPILLDEAKSKFMEGDGSKNKITPEEFESIIRSTFTSSEHSRGTAAQKTITYDALSPLKVNLPEDISRLDQATIYRSYVLRTSPDDSARHRKEFKYYEEKYRHSNIPERIGATLAKWAIKLPDFEGDNSILELIIKCKKTVDKYCGNFDERQRDGLAKIIFGNMILQKIFGKKAWNYQRAKEVLIGATEELTEFNEITGTRIKKDAPSDWHRLMAEFLSRMSERVPDHKLREDYDFWFVKNAANKDYVLTLDVARAYAVNNKWHKVYGDNSKSIALPLKDFLRCAVNENALIPFGKALVKGAMIPIYGGDPVGGKWVQLSVKSLIQKNLEIGGIPGTVKIIADLTKYFEEEKKS